MEGKDRAAFRAGFLGVQSLGWSTLVQIVEASEDDRAAAVDTLARHLVAGFGAPSVADALAAAEEEVAFAASLCDHPPDTLIAVHRTVENGEIREAFRTLRPRGERKPHARVLVPRSRGRGRTGRDGRSGEPGEGREGRQGMKDFWLSCGHHLLDRDEGGGLVVTDEFLKAYLARPELNAAREACVVERTLHAALLTDPRRPVDLPGDRRDRGHGCARELGDHDRVPRSLDRAPDARGRLSASGAHRLRRHAARCSSTSSCT